MFCANMVKNILDGIIHQITVFVENHNKIENYTILLMENRLMVSICGVVIMFRVRLLKKAK